MLVLDDARIRDLVLRVVDNSDTLMILFLEALGLKMKATVLKLAELVAKVLVNRACVDDLLGHILIRRALLEIIEASTHLDAVNQCFDQLVVAADWDALIAVIELLYHIIITPVQLLLSKFSNSLLSSMSSRSCGSRNAYKLRGFADMAIFLIDRIRGGILSSIYHVKFKYERCPIVVLLHFINISKRIKNKINKLYFS